MISTNDPDNEDTVTNVLVPALNRDCGDGGSVAQHHYFYSQDISTAAQQINAGISAMDSPSDPGHRRRLPVRPGGPRAAVLGRAAAQLLPREHPRRRAGHGRRHRGPGLRVDGDTAIARLPAVPGGCEFDNAFGITSAATLRPARQGARSDHVPARRREEPPHAAVRGHRRLGALEHARQPHREHRPRPDAGADGGGGTGHGHDRRGTTGHAEVGFSKGSYNWTIDAGVVYWGKSTPSPYNGKPGTFMSIEGSRFLPGNYPKLSEPPIPKIRSS